MSGSHSSTIMVSILNKQLSRELITYPGLIVTLTSDGIYFRRYGKHKSEMVPWEEVFGVLAFNEVGRTALRQAAGHGLRKIDYKRKPA